MSKKILFAILGLVILGALATTAYLAFNDESSRHGERGIIITPREAKAFLTDSDIERWAVVVGISDYKNNPAVTDLKYADRDAQSFYDFLVSPQGGCFKTENIQLLLNQKATVSNLRYALGTFLGKTADKDLVVIYMAGHGAPDPKKWENLYFLTHDADLDSLPNTAYPMDDLTRDLQRYIKAKKVIVITDACHSAAVSGGMIAMRGNEGHRVNEYLKKLAESREGCTFITASRAGEGSQESEKWGGGHGVFTYFLLEGLKGNADRNGDGFITMKEAYDYLYPKVQRESENGQAPFASAYLDNSIPMGICNPDGLLLKSKGIPINQDLLNASINEVMETAQPIPMNLEFQMIGAVILPQFKSVFILNTLNNQEDICQKGAILNSKEYGRLSIFSIKSDETILHQYYNDGSVEKEYTLKLTPKSNTPVATKQKSSTMKTYRPGEKQPEPFKKEDVDNLSPESTEKALAKTPANDLLGIVRNIPDSMVESVLSALPQDYLKQKIQESPIGGAVNEETYRNHTPADIINILRKVADDYTPKGENMLLFSTQVNSNDNSPISPMAIFDTEPKKIYACFKNRVPIAKLDRVIIKWTNVSTRKVAYWSAFMLNPDATNNFIFVKQDGRWETGKYLVTLYKHIQDINPAAYGEFELK